MPRKARSGGAKAKAKGKHFQALNVTLGDKIRVERRFVVDGQLTSVFDQGVFHGVQAMGSIEHVLLERKGEVHLIPIPSISEIVLEEASAKRSSAASQPHDPSFA